MVIQEEYKAKERKDKY